MSNYYKYVKYWRNFLTIENKLSFVCQKTPFSYTGSFVNLSQKLEPGSYLLKYSVEHQYLACMILMISPFNWYYALTYFKVKFVAAQKATIP